VIREVIIELWSDFV